MPCRLFFWMSSSCKTYAYSLSIAWSLILRVFTALSILQIILAGIFTPPSDEFGMQLYIGAYNTIFLFVAVSVVIGMGSCIVGQTTRLPLVADAADSQVRDSPGGW